MKIKDVTTEQVQSILVPYFENEIQGVPGGELPEAILADNLRANAIIVGDTKVYTVPLATGALRMALQKNGVVPMKLAEQMGHEALLAILQALKVCLITGLLMGFRLRDGLAGEAGDTQAVLEVMAEVSAQIRATLKAGEDVSEQLLRLSQVSEEYEREKEATPAS